MKKIFIIAGEVSGDMHAASLARQLKINAPEVELVGLGGPKMQEAGVKLLYNLVDLAVVGFIEVFKSIFTLRKIFKMTKEFLQKEKPAVVVLVDYPGFNFKIGHLAKSLNIPVVYYIAPQLWAWWKSRIRQIKDFTTKVLVIFPFEEELYKKEKIDVAFVGHPFLEMIPPVKNSKEIFNQLQLNPEQPVIGLMPGSRKQEVEHLLPPMLTTAEKINEKIPDIQFVLILASGIDLEFVQKIISQYSIGVKVIQDQNYRLRQILTLALVSSGTATLENACLGVPMVIMYKVSKTSYWLAKQLVKVPYIGMVNIVMQEEVVPEFIQEKINPQKIAEIVIRWIKEPQRLKDIAQKLSQVKERLGTPGANQRASEYILKLVKNTIESNKNT